MAIAPVLVGVLFLLFEPDRPTRDLAAAVGLAVLATIHLLYWCRPRFGRQQRSVAAAAGMVVTTFVLLNLLGLPEPLVWLYPP